MTTSVSDFRRLAEKRLPRMLFEYIDGGSYDEATLRRNVADFGGITLRQRVMRDMTALGLETSLLGRTRAMPIGLAPVGLAGMYARRGETQAAAAAAAAGVPFCLSTMGVCSVEEVAQAGMPPWFQLYMLKDRVFMAELLQRVRSAGCEALVFTVDLPVPGARYRDMRSGFTGHADRSPLLRRTLDGISHPNWLWDVWLRGRPHSLGSIAAAVGGRGVADFLGWIAANFDRSVTWRDIDWVRQKWDGPLIVKGVLDPEDARSAAAAGTQAIIVSNHGGRQLDGVRSSISALPRIAQAVGDDVEIYLDGGVRSGLDVLKALAMGAKACFIGRPWAWALAAGGRAAVTRLLTNFHAELEVALILTGCRDIRGASDALLDMSEA